MKRILVTNDDGIHAPGIQALEAAIADLAEVHVVAPLDEQSATSHALTLHRPLRMKEFGERRMAVDGTPTDCVLIAVRELLEEPPDLVVSGINQGPNLGEDVIYSGTVAGAMEGTILGIPAVAISHGSRTDRDFSTAASVARALVAQLLELDHPYRFLVNVNVPAVPLTAVRGTRVTRLGTRFYEDDIIRKTDPRGRDYFWVGGTDPQWEPEPDTDFAALADGYVSLTPVLTDLTDRERLGMLTELDLGIG